MSEKILSVRNLTINFKTDAGAVQAVRNISFDLYKGETLAIVGESGSGKSVTNRAIMRILANNGIVKDGRIIYDGKDLLKISEEEMVKLRGDKIAMIFQDPLSALNPIVRVGKQLTEAMLLKGKANQRNARNDFNTMLARLKENMLACYEGDEAKKAIITEMCSTFDGFCIESIKHESAYNNSMRAAIELKSEIDNLLFFIEKRQAFDIKKNLNKILRYARDAVNKYVVVEDAEYSSLLAAVENERKGRKEKIPTLTEEGKNALLRLAEISEESQKKTVPNFFCMGYYALKHPEDSFDNYDIETLNEKAHESLKTEFMDTFIGYATEAYKHNRERVVAKKKAVLDRKDEFISFFSGDLSDKAAVYAKAKEISSLVKDSIDLLAYIKDSADYTFESSFYSELDKYYAAVKNNPKEQARFDRQSKKYDALVAKGKEPDWKVVPANLVDLGDQQKSVLTALEFIFEHTEENISSEYDCAKHAEELIDWFKEKASAVVYKVTHSIAKVKALKLLEEVGIPEPAIRYNQYPFELSGGMRQRIVIAIALAANPDILICDEPTTALDVTIQSQILELINRVKAERRLSVIFITHNLGVVANMADRVAVMYAGKIVEIGTADDVFYAPAHPYTWALLSSMPDLDTKEKLEAIPGTPPNMIYPPKGDAFAPRNKYAMQIDFEAQPPMFKISETHSAATWLLHPDAPHVDPPKIVTDRIKRMTKKETSENE